MEAVFIKILNMSIVASWLIFAVIIFRLLLKSAPKWIRCVMWAMVAVRLIIPFSFESRLSLIPNTQKLYDTGNSSTAYVNSAPVIFQETEDKPDILAIVSLVWLIGVAVMLIYMLSSYIYLRIAVRESVRLKGNIRLCDHIKSSFVLGFFNPIIYLDSALTDKETEYVIAHEQAHLKRHDNIWKPLGFILLSVYWFNPLCWIAYWLFNKDIELACDEKVVKTLDVQGKKEYSTALLLCSSNHHMIAACPLAFGENNVKQRIKSALHYKKPSKYVVVTAGIACLFVAVSFMTDPLSASATNFIKENLVGDISVNLTDYDISKSGLSIVYSDINEALENENLDKEYVDSITKIELSEADMEIKVYIKSLDDDKQQWFRENISDNPYLIFIMVVEETEPPATEPETQPETVAIEEVYDELYDDSSYDSYNETYTDDSYSDDSNSSDRYFEIQPYEESELYQKNQEQYHNIYGGYSSDGVSLSVDSNEWSSNTDSNGNDVLKWD